MKLCLILILFLVVSLVDSQQKQRRKMKQGAKQRTANRINESDLQAGAKLGFKCRIVQRPMFRSHQKRPKVIFTSITIIRYTRIVISGEIAFDLICSRDTSTDQGDVVPPKVAAAAAKNVPDVPQEGADSSGGGSATTEEASEGGEDGGTEGGTDGGTEGGTEGGGDESGGGEEGGNQGGGEEGGGEPAGGFSPAKENDPTLRGVHL